MKANEVHKMSDQELKAEEGRLRKELFDKTGQMATQKLEKPHVLGQMRRDIARILTEKQLRQAKAKA